MPEVSKLRQKIRGKGKQDLAKRHKEAVERKDEGRFASIYNKSKIPSGIQFWAIGNNQHLIDIVPFESGPTIPNPNVNEGDIEWVVDLWRHRNIGPRELAFVCPARTWNEPCPICEDISANNYDDDKVEKIKAKRMCNYLVWVHDSPKEEKEGLKILELAYFFLQKHVDELAVSPRGGGILQFTDIDEGKSVAFTKSGAGSQNWSFIGHQFVDRTEPIPDWICDQSFSLDSVINMRPSYEEVHKAYHGAAGASKEDNPSEQSEPTPAEQSSSEGHVYDSNSCPAGGVIGKDLDKLDHCTDCKNWDKCVTISNQSKGGEAESKSFPDAESQEGFEHAMSKDDSTEQETPPESAASTAGSESRRQIPRRRRRPAE